jgi:hypothetical protein
MLLGAHPPVKPIFKWLAAHGNRIQGICGRQARLPSSQPRVYAAAANGDECADIGLVSSNTQANGFELCEFPAPQAVRRKQRPAIIR